MPKRWGLILSLSLSVMLIGPGCTFTDNLSGQIERNSQSLHDATMEALLINIVRSAYGEPISFTQATNVMATGSVSGSMGLPFILFGSGPTPPQLSQNGLGIFGNNMLSVQNGNNINLAVLDNREFWLGMLTPLSFETVNFFISQGVPRDVMFSLYIQQEKVESDQGVVIYNNDPFDPRFGEFINQMRMNLELGMTTVALARSQTIGPPLRADEVSNLQHLVQLTQAGLQLAPVAAADGPRYQLMTGRLAAALCFDARLATVSVAGRVVPQSTCAAMAGATSEDHGSASGQSSFSFRGDKADGDAARAPSTYTLYPRSTYGVIRYLGQVMRAGLESPSYNSLVDGIAREFGRTPVSARLFLVEKNGSTADSFVSVVYRGDTYSIPRSATTTIEVLGLLRQMIALSLSVNALPVGSSTTVIAQ